MENEYIKQSRLKGKRDRKSHNKIKDDKITLKYRVSNKQFKDLKAMLKENDHE